MKAKDPSTLFDWTITMAITSPGKRVFRLIISLCYPFLPRNIVICIHSKKKKNSSTFEWNFCWWIASCFFSRARRVREWIQKRSISSEQLLVSKCFEKLFNWFTRKLVGKILSDEMIIAKIFRYLFFIVCLAQKLLKILKRNVTL